MENLTAKELIKMYEDQSNEDEMLGWIKGVNAVNQNKDYVSSNSMAYEMYAKRNIYNVGHMDCSLMKYYISQEEGYDNWYKKKDWTHYHTGW